MGLLPFITQHSRMLINSFKSHCIPIYIYIPEMALIRVRSPLLTESRLISSVPVTKMFQFTSFNLAIFIKKRFPDRKSACSLMGSSSLSHFNTSFFLSKYLGVPLVHYVLVYLGKKRLIFNLLYYFIFSFIVIYKIYILHYIHTYIHLYIYIYIYTYSLLLI